MDTRYKAAITLTFIAPYVGEGLSTSTPFIGFVNLFNLLLLIFLYGFGALIVREYSIKWFVRNNWIAMLLLGMVYGMIEEGIFLLSFFNPNWPDVGIFGTYGRFWRVNWSWAMHLTLFHAVFSIVIPIIMTYLLYPELQKERWLSDRLLNKVIMIFAFGGIVWFLFVTNEYDYIPDFPEYIFFLVLIISIIVLVKKKGKVMHVHVNKNEFPIFGYYILASVTSIVFFLFPFLAVQWQLPAVAEIIIEPVLFVSMLYILASHISSNGRIQYKYAVAGSYGLLTFCFILLLGTDMLSIIAFGGISILLIILIWKKHRMQEVDQYELIFKTS